MRRRGVRIFAFVVVIVALSIATLSYKEINIGSFERNGGGPLGVSLGLDLQGGSHLVYQADVPVEVIFQDLVEESQLRTVLDELGHPDSTIRSPGQREFTILDLTLDEQAHGKLREALGDLAIIEALSTGDDVLNVTFVDDVNEADLRRVLGELGDSSVTVPQKFTIRGLPLDEQEQVELESGIRGLGPAAFFDPGDPLTGENMKGVQEIIQRRVNALGTSKPIIQTLGDDRIVVQLPGVGGSSVEVTFQSIPAMMAEIAFAVQGMGYSGDVVQILDITSLAIRPDKPLPQEDRDALVDLAKSFSPGVGISGSGDEDEDIIVTFPVPPSQGTIIGLMGGLGFADFTVEQRREDLSTFLIRTEDSLATEDQTAIREAMEDSIGRIIAFETRGGIEEAKALIGQTAQLVVRERTCLSTVEELLAVPGLCRPVERGGAGFFEESDVILTGANLDRALLGSDPTTGIPEVIIHFDSTGADIFSDLTRRLVNDPLGRIAFYLDDEEISAPVVRGHSPDGITRISGGFTRETARTLVRQLESGRLPVPLTLIRESSVDAFLGKDSLRKSLIAASVGLGLVLLFMLAYYRAAGVVAGVALLVYAVILLAILKLIPIDLELSGVAALVLSIGMAVDANILIFERMKEEMRTGRSLTSAMDVGFRRAWPAIRDSNVSTIITCIILFLLGSRLGAGTPVVTNFAVTLLIGVPVSMFTAITVSRNLLQILALTPMGKHWALFSPEPRRQPVGGVTGGGVKSWIS